MKMHFASAVMCNPSVSLIVMLEVAVLLPPPLQPPFSTDVAIFSAVTEKSESCIAKDDITTLASAY